MPLNLFTQDWGSCVQNIPGAEGAGVPTLSCVWVALSNIINAALVLSGVVAVFLIIWSGFQYVTSSGDKEKVDNARKRLTYAIIGLVFIFLSFLIINFISQFTGIDINQITQPPGAENSTSP
jgi:cytochrome bd-type quinol oxidase subunit 2